MCLCVCVCVPCRQCSRCQQVVRTLLQSEPPELCTVWSECPLWSVCAGQERDREKSCLIGSYWHYRERSCLIGSYWHYRESGCTTERKRRRWWRCLTTQHAFPRSAIFTLSLWAFWGSRGLRTKSDALNTEKHKKYIKYYWFYIYYILCVLYIL